MIDALKPGSPIENLLRQIEDKPMPQELEAINAYAQPGFYTMMNAVLNKSNDKEFMSKVPQEAKSLISLAISGLRKMKPYKGGSVYRGQPGLRSDYVKNTLLFQSKSERQKVLDQNFKKDQHYSQFISTSKRPYQAYSIQKDKWMAIEIQNVKSGVDISAISNTLYEREVLFPPNVTLKVISVEDKFVTKVGATLTDLENKYAEAPIADKEGRVKVVYEEV
jgi:ADP-ribosyltransferase exoenzyme